MKMYITMLNVKHKQRKHNYMKHADQSELILVERRKCIYNYIIYIYIYIYSLYHLQQHNYIGRVLKYVEL